MTEVPEYLLERSRSRRIALGLLSDDGSGAGGGGGAIEAAGGGAPAAGPSPAELIAAAKSAAKLETPPEPAADPVWVEAARSRSKIPLPVLSLMFFMPLWAFVYVKLTEPAPEPVTALSEGAATYAGQCASCHMGDGSGSLGGGVGRPLWEGEVLLTFPALDDSMIEWLEVGSNGIGLGNVYGDPNRPGGPHVSGETGGVMPGFGENLSDYKIYSVARYVREVLSGEALSEEEVEARDLEWEARGGGKDLGGGGGGGGH